MLRGMAVLTLQYAEFMDNLHSILSHVAIHRIREYSEWTGTHKDHQVHLLALHRTP